jgi:hypothetical protein
VRPPLTFDDCLVLDIDRLIRERYVVPGMRKDGRVMFPSGFWVPYAFDGAKTLTLTMPDGPQRIRLITYAQVHGRRHVFEVPPHHVRKLYYLPGDTAFRTRHALGLKYRSWTTGLKRRRAAMIEKLRKRLGVTGTHVKPPGMHRAEWFSLLIRLAELDGAER